MKWQSSAPSNIALIKYMGKIGQTGNVSSNPSISYTLDHLLTFIEMELISDKVNSSDRWESLKMDGYPSIEISANGQSRFLKHLLFLKEKMKFSGSFIVRTNNNFPSDCGLASSASSFAALTLCAYKAIKDINPSLDLSLEQLADLSRQGSGSSCRSLFTPWSVWDETGARSIDIPIRNLLHQVVVISDQVKSVSSSEAHKRISTSLLSRDRTQRATERQKELISSMRNLDWKKSYELIWADFWDMHALFETSHPPFGYMSHGSQEVLRLAQNLWERQGDGPWITMDAGPNVHLLFRKDQLDQANKLEEQIARKYKIITNYKE